MLIKPMSAGKFDEKFIQFPVFVSPKLDGVRCLAVDKKPMSKAMKILPSKHLQEVFYNNGYHHWLDGEIIVGNETDKDACRKTVSYVMSHDKVYDFTYHVFDLYNIDKPFNVRYEYLKTAVANIDEKYKANIKIVETKLVTTLEEIYTYEQEQIDLGHEGIMIRGYDSPYKHGRSSSREAYLLKLKRWVDAEGEIIGYEEKMHNANEQKTSELGYSERSSFKDGMVPTNTLGAFIVRVLNGEFKGSILKVGSGFNAKDRIELWSTREEQLGRILKFKYFDKGTKDLPRFPIFLNFRDKIDMSLDDD